MGMKGAITQNPPRTINSSNNCCVDLSAFISPYIKQILVMTAPSRIKITVSGLVQGVGFRYFTYRVASKLSLNGYVQNKNDGSVEVVAEGDRSKLLMLVEELRIGPPGASVDNFRVRWENPQNDLKDFKILR